MQGFAAEMASKPLAVAKPSYMSDQKVVHPIEIGQKPLVLPTNFLVILWGTSLVIVLDVTRVPVRSKKNIPKIFPTGGSGEIRQETIVLVTNAKRLRA